MLDVDGTLFQTETATIPAIESVFAEHGLAPPARAKIRQFYGRPDEEFVAWLDRWGAVQVRPCGLRAEAREAIGHLMPAANR